VAGHCGSLAPLPGTDRCPSKPKTKCVNHFSQNMVSQLTRSHSDGDVKGVGPQRCNTQYRRRNLGEGFDRNNDRGNSQYGSERELRDLFHVVPSNIITVQLGFSLRKSAW
jgi:hypothetical protein